MFDSIFSPIASEMVLFEATDNAPDEYYYPDDTTIIPESEINEGYDSIADKAFNAIEYTVGMETDRYLQKITPLLETNNVKAIDEIDKKQQWSIGVSMERTLWNLWDESWDWGNGHAIRELNELGSDAAKFSNYDLNLAEFASRTVFVPYPPTYGLPLSEMDLSNAARQRVLKLANDVDDRGRREIQGYIRQTLKKHQSATGVPRSEINGLVSQINLALGRQRLRETWRPFPNLSPQQSEGGEQVNVQNRPPGAMGLIPRAKLITQTEVGASYNLARLQVYGRAKIQYVRYVAVMDGRTSKICRTRNGTVHKLSVVLAQTKFAGRAIYDPSQFILPAHPNCRSHWEPLLETRKGDKPIITSPGRNPATRQIQKNTTNWVKLGTRVGVVAATTPVDDILIVGGVKAAATAAGVVGSTIKQSQEEVQRAKNKAKRNLFLAGSAALSLGVLYGLLSRQLERDASVGATQTTAQTIQNVIANQVGLSPMASVNAAQRQAIINEVANDIKQLPVLPTEVVNEELSIKYPLLLSAAPDLRITTDTQLKMLYGVFGKDLKTLRDLQKRYEQQRMLPTDKALPPANLAPEMLAQYPQLRNLEDLRDVDIVRLTRGVFSVAQLRDKVREYGASLIGMPYTPVDDLNVNGLNIANGDPKQVAELLNLEIDQVLSLQQVIQIRLNKGEDVRLTDLSKIDLPKRTRDRTRKRVSPKKINEIIQGRMLATNSNPNAWLFLLGGRERLKFIEGTFGVSKNIAQIMQEVLIEYGIPDDVQAFVNAVEIRMQNAPIGIRNQWPRIKAELIARFSNRMQPIGIPAIQPIVQQQLSGRQPQKQIQGVGYEPFKELSPAPKVIEIQGVQIAGSSPPIQEQIDSNRAKPLITQANVQGTGVLTTAPRDIPMPTRQNQNRLFQLPGVRSTLETFKDRVIASEMIAVDDAINSVREAKQFFEDTLAIEVNEAKATKSFISPKIKTRNRLTINATNKQLTKARSVKNTSLNIYATTNNNIQKLENTFNDIRQTIDNFDDVLSGDVYDLQTGQLIPRVRNDILNLNKEINRLQFQIETTTNNIDKQIDSLLERKKQHETISNQIQNRAEEIILNPTTESFTALQKVNSVLDSAISEIDTKRENLLLGLSDQQKDALLAKRQSLVELKNNVNNVQQRIVLQESNNQILRIEQMIAELNAIKNPDNLLNIREQISKLNVLKNKLDALPTTLNVADPELATRWELYQDSKQILKVQQQQLRDVKNKYLKKIREKQSQWATRTQNTTNTDGEIVQSEYNRVTSYHKPLPNGETLHDGEVAYKKSQLQDRLLNWQSDEWLMQGSEYQFVRGYAEDYFSIIHKATQHLKDLEFDIKNPNKVITNTLLKLGITPEELGIDGDDISSLMRRGQTTKELTILDIGRARRQMIEGLQRIVQQNTNKLNTLLSTNSPKALTSSRLAEVAKEREYWVQQLEYVENSIVVDMDNFKQLTNNILDSNPDLYNRWRLYDVESAIEIQKNNIRAEVNQYIKELDEIIDRLNVKLKQPESLQSTALHKITGEQPTIIVNTPVGSPQPKPDVGSLATRKTIPIQGKSYNISEIENVANQINAEVQQMGVRRRVPLEIAWKRWVDQNFKSSEFEQILNFARRQKEITGGRYDQIDTIFTPAQLTSLKAQGFEQYVYRIQQIAQTAPDELNILIEAANANSVVKIKNYVHTHRMRKVADVRMKAIENELFNKEGVVQELAVKYGIDIELDFAFTPRDANSNTFKDVFGYPIQIVKAKLNFTRPNEMNKFKPTKRLSSEDNFVNKYQEKIRQLKNELGDVYFEVDEALPGRDTVLQLNTSEGRVQRTASIDALKGDPLNLNRYTYSELQQLKRDWLHELHRLDSTLDILGFSRYNKNLKFNQPFAKRSIKRSGLRGQRVLTNRKIL